ncbi:MAG: UbiD family decarboxylase [Deltaproteobacteria bacterium]|nr:UbiD family decarboxylase [Deltaproteobacteria bacterium]
MKKNLNMRDWIDTLEKSGELITLNKPVDPNTEMGALLYKSRDKSLYFKEVTGFPGWRALGQAPANVRHAALAFDTTPENVVREFASRIKNLRKPKLVDSGPVQEVIFEREDVDMTKLPAHIAGTRDGGRFITSGLVIVKDPDTGIQNMSFHRMQIKGPQKLGILMVPRHLYLIYQKNEARNQPTPISVIIGHHPMYYFAAAYTGPADLDELQMAGALLQENVEVIRCKNGLLAPAHAEICYEGEILPHEREEEGPFSEFQDYYVAGTGTNPVIRVDRLTMRKDAIYKEIQNGSEVEGCVYHKVPMSAAIYERLKTVGGYTDLVNVMVLPGIFGVVAQLKQRFKGEAKNVLLSALSSQYLHQKIAIAIDEDVDIFNPAEILWAISTRVNPQNDIFVVEDTRIHPMDPTGIELVKPGSPLGWSRIGSKMGIDATKPPLSDPVGRDLFERIQPINLGKVKLEDYL